MTHEHSYAKGSGCTRHFVHANAPEFNPLFIKTKYNEEATGIMVARDIGLPIPDIGIKGMNGVYSARWQTEVCERPVSTQYLALGIGNLEIIQSTKTLASIHEGTANPMFELLHDVQLGDTSHLRISLDPQTLAINQYRIIAWNENPGEILRLVKTAGKPTFFVSCEITEFNKGNRNRQNIERMLKKNSAYDSEVTFSSQTRRLLSLSMGEDNRPQQGGYAFIGVKTMDGTVQVVNEKLLEDTDAYEYSIGEDGIVSSITLELPWTVGPLEQGDVATITRTVDGLSLFTYSAEIQLPELPKVEREQLSDDLSLEEYVSKASDRLQEVLEGSVLNGEKISVVVNP